MSVAPFMINNLIPDEEEIEWEIRRLRYNCSVALSGMRAEYLRKWFKESQKADVAAATDTEAGTDIGDETEMDTNMYNWRKLVDLI